MFDRDNFELGWRAAMGLWLENRTFGPKIVGWVSPFRELSEALVHGPLTWVSTIEKDDD
jgi:hypothetical protein